MISRKKKTCKACGEEAYLYARGMCAHCDRKVNPQKHGLLKPSGESSPERVQTPQKRKRIAPVSEKQARRLKEYRKLRDAYLKANNTCEFPGCTSTEVTLHHGAGRVGDLLTDTNYFVALCFKHHRFVEENPTEAKGMGLSYNRLDK